MAQVHLHRYAVFGPDGRAVLRGIAGWQGLPQTPGPGIWSHPDYPGLYTVSLDDAVEHWHDLEAEVWALGHDDPKVQASAAPGAFRHDGGTTHPRFPHGRLGGVLSWQRDHRRHPAITARAADTKTWDTLTLALHFGGTDFKER